MLMKEHNSYAQSTASAIMRLISEGHIKTKDVSKAVRLSEEQLSSILTEDPDALTREQIKDLILTFGLSPLFISTEQGEAAISADNQTGKLLRTMNHIICEDRIASMPEYFRLLRISEVQEYIWMCQGRRQLSDNKIVEICMKYDINVVAIFKPVAATPLFI